MVRFCTWCELIIQHAPTLKNRQRLQRTPSHNSSLRDGPIGSSSWQQYNEFSAFCCYLPVVSRRSMTEADKLGHKVFASVSPSNDKSTINDHHFVYDYSIAYYRAIGLVYCGGAYRNGQHHRNGWINYLWMNFREALAGRFDLVCGREETSCRMASRRSPLREWWWWCCLWKTATRCRRLPVMESAF